MKYIFLTLTLIFTSVSQASLTEKSFTTLTCRPNIENAVIHVIFPRAIKASVPFTRFAEIWGKVTLDHKKLRRQYVRERVLFIPEKLPPGSDMRGQSSDSLYIQLHPQFINDEFNGIYHGQLFINDKDDEFRGTYFRYMNNEDGPGIVCHPNQE